MHGNDDDEDDGKMCECVYVCVHVFCMQYLCTNIHLCGIYILQSTHTHGGWQTTELNSNHLYLTLCNSRNIDICSFVMKMRTYYEWMEKKARGIKCANGKYCNKLKLKVSQPNQRTNDGSEEEKSTGFRKKQYLPSSSVWHAWMIIS